MKGKPEAISKDRVMYSGGDGEGTLRPPDTPFKGDKKRNCRHELSVRTQNSPIPGTHAPPGSTSKEWKCSWLFLEKLHLAILGTETVRSFERTWEGEEYIKKGLYTKAEPETHDSGMNTKGEMKTRMPSDLELTKRCGKQEEESLYKHIRRKTWPVTKHEKGWILQCLISQELSGTRQWGRISLDTQDVQVQGGWSKGRTEQTHQSAKWLQVSRSTEGVPTVLGEPPSIIFKPLTTAMQMPDRPGKVWKKWKDQTQHPVLQRKVGAGKPKYF